MYRLVTCVCSHRYSVDALGVLHVVNTEGNVFDKLVASYSLPEADPLESKPTTDFCVAKWHSHHYLLSVKAVLYKQLASFKAGLLALNLF